MLPEKRPRLATAERKHLTVLFADLIGFTALAEKLDAEEVHELINGIWVRLDAIISQHGGTIDKHIGDAVMALFGARRAQEDDPEKAIRAGLEMQACLRKLRSDPQHPPLQLRVGIHTGPVLLGFIGSTREYTATGDTVNLASRLQTQAPVGGVLISQDTFRQVCGIFDVQVPKPLLVKGKDEPVQVYQVMRAKPRPLALRARGIEGIERHMIGREQELKRLQLAVQKLTQEGEPQMVTLVGEAGVGKSCLVQELQKWVDVLPRHFRLFSGRATTEMAALPFSLIRDVFCNRFNIQENDRPEIAREKFERGLVALLGGNPGSGGIRKLQNQAHFIGQLLGLDFSSSPNIAGVLHDAAQMRHRAFHYLARFFAGVSRTSRLPEDTSASEAALLILEDLHWADEGSLDLIEFLAGACGRVPLLILCVARPALLDRRPGWGKTLATHTFLELKPLSPDKSRALVQNLLRKASAVPQELLQLIASGAEGNPFYIEEIIKMLIDDKVIIPGHERWRIEPARLASFSIPPTLTGVLQARLDGLTPAERAILQRAAVVGRIFWDSAIIALRDPAATGAEKISSDTALLNAQVPEILLTLQRKDLIFRHGTSAFGGAAEYSFTNELLRKVTYDTVLMRLRREYHPRAGAWFVAQGGGRVLEFAGLVAAHFEKGDRLAEAAEWYGRAGQQARVRDEPAAAIELFQKALALASAGSSSRVSSQSKLDWHEGLAEVLGAQARFAEALKVAQAAGRLAAESDNLLARVRALNTLAFLQERMGENLESIRSAEQARVLVEQPGADDPALRTELIRALHLKGWACYRLGSSSTVLELAEYTSKLCNACGDRRLLITSLKLHGVAHLQLGNYACAEDYFRQGLALARELGDRRNTGAMLSNLGETARLRGDFQTATSLYQRAVAISRVIGHRESELIYLSNLAGARLGLGQFMQAEADLRQVLALAGRGKTSSLAETYTFLSEACCEQGKFKEAWEAAERALSLAKNSANILDLGAAWRALARAAAGRQRMKEPHLSAAAAADPCAYFEESLRVYEQIGAEGDRARTLQAWGIYELERGRLVTSRKLMDEARAISTRLGITQTGI